MATLSEKVPLVTEPSGDVRVEGTRIFLEQIVRAFNEGKTPEEIHYSYPSLDLADIYSILTYYLRHRSEVDAYVSRQTAKAEAVERMTLPLRPTALDARIKRRLGEG
ncbi:DUF433 domain-containing protein [Calidithermus roseus]|uniref:DUF433 domain-containing protein n=1 Tax=Calidithermus roseus TaxID=1644118 RepID=UPI000E6572D4|nr:DUF433 domain-containing protein [Calidithermus roseus]